MRRAAVPEDIADIAAMLMGSKYLTGGGCCGRWGGEPGLMRMCRAGRWWRSASTAIVCNLGFTLAAVVVSDDPAQNVIIS